MWLDTVVDRRAVLCILDRPPATADDLLRQVLTDFGVLSRADKPSPDVSAGDLTAVLRHFLTGLRALDARAIVVIENATATDESTRAEIDRLSALDPGVLEVLLVEPQPPVSGWHMPAARRIVMSAAVAGAIVSGWLWLARPTSSPPAGTRRAVDASDLRAVAVALQATDDSSQATAPPQRSEPRSAATSGQSVPAGVGAAYRVQIGAFRDPANAGAVVAQFEQLKLPVEARGTSNGLRQVTLGPFVLKAEASAALEEARAAGFGDAVLVAEPRNLEPFSGADRTLLARAEAIAEQHDVRALEALRAAWLDESTDAARGTSPVLAAIDQYLDAARRVRLALDRQRLLQERGRK